jgi:hypothetical protein
MGLGIALNGLQADSANRNLEVKHAIEPGRARFMRPRLISGDARKLLAAK